MQPHQQRVVDEKTELDTKWLALISFTTSDIFNGLSEYERNLLRDQAAVMKTYSDILAERIATFK